VPKGGVSKRASKATPALATAGARPSAVVQAGGYRGEGVKKEEWSPRRQMEIRHAHLRGGVRS